VAETPPDSPVGDLVLGCPDGGDLGVGEHGPRDRARAERRAARAVQCGADRDAPHRVGGVGVREQPVDVARGVHAVGAGGHVPVDHHEAAFVDTYPAASSPRSVVAGRRPTATSSCCADTVDAVPVCSTTRSPSPRTEVT
jgi:hypothetical protein